MSAFAKILHDELPVRPWQHDVTRRLPGIQPLDLSDWILVDEVYARQMAYRDWLTENQRDVILRQLDDFDIAVAEELLDMICADLQTKAGFDVSAQKVTRPDGIAVDLMGDHPLIVAARLVQQDFLIMERRDEVQVLTAGVLCFPASWSLGEKLGRSLMGIHKPIVYYDETLNKRISRLFEAIKPDRPMWRANHLTYGDADLFQPRTEANRRHKGGRFMRVERQALRRLPKTEAVVFSLHTYVVPMRPEWVQELAALAD